MQSKLSEKTEILNVIKPNGKWIGKAGTNNYIRILKGGQREAVEVFERLTKDAKIIYTGKDKIVSQLSNDIYVTYRHVSKSGPPTINIRISNHDKPIKIKFIK